MPQSQDAYGLWESLPDNFQELIPAPASKSFSRMVSDPDDAEKLKALVAILGGKQRPRDDGDLVWVVVCPETGEAVMSSIENAYEVPGSVWIYLPVLCHMIFGASD